MTAMLTRALADLLACTYLDAAPTVAENDARRSLALDARVEMDALRAREAALTAEVERLRVEVEVERVGNVWRKMAGDAKTDTERDRRLEAGEEDRIRAAIQAGVLPRKQRPFHIPHPDDLMRDFTLAVDTGMRLRERYTLEVQQIKMHQRTIYLDKTKNGDSRNVPMSSHAMAAMEAQIRGKEPDDRVFPWWNGDGSKMGRKLASNFMSKLYAQVFETAGCPDLTEHDLRHEATSRLFERTNLAGEAIMKITGHKSHKMLMRYLKLRGSDLAQQLW